MVDVLRSINPLETHGEEDVQNAADSLAAQVERQPKIFLDRTGTFRDPVLTAVFSTMQERSLEGKYHTPDGRQRIFYHMPYDGEALLALDTPEGKEAALVNLASFAAQVPAFLDRARTGIVQSRRHGPKQVWNHFQGELPEDVRVDQNDPVAVMKDLVEARIENHKGENDKVWWSNVHELMVLFGNPSQELYDTYGYKRYEDLPNNPDYPVLTPIIDITLSPYPIPEDPFGILDGYNKKIAPFMDDIFNGKVKREEVMTPGEIRFADQSSSIARLMAIMTSFTNVAGNQTPHVGEIIVAPMFPVHQINRHDGYTWENWSGLSSNDSLAERYKAHPIAKI